MSCVRIHIDLDNDAFNGDDCGPELARILREIARHVEHIDRSDLEGHEPTPRDSNGNKVGHVSFEIDDDDDDNTHDRTDRTDLHDDAAQDFVDSLDPRVVVQIIESDNREPYRNGSSHSNDDEANAEYLVELINDGEIDFDEAKELAVKFEMS